MSEHTIKNAHARNPLWSDGKLQEQVESLQREITRVQYKNNELERVRQH